jgi:hypothetical protein
MSRRLAESRRSWAAVSLSLEAPGTAVVFGSRNIVEYLGTFGSIAPARAVLIGRRYLRSFFDRFLRDRDDGLLDGPSADFPEVIFGHP